MPDLALALQRRERRDRVLEANVRVDAVQLIQIDPLEPQPAQAALQRVAQVRRAGVRAPVVGTGSRPATLRGDHDVGRIGRERLGDQLFAYVRTV